MKIDAYLRIYARSGPANKGEKGGEVRGESQDDRFRKAIALTGFECGAVSSDASDLLDKKDAQTGEKLSTQFAKFGFKVNKEADRASPYLFRAYGLTFAGKLVDGENYFAAAEVTFRKATGADPLEYLRMSFYGVLVGSFDLALNDDGTTEESVGFRFRECRMRYVPQTAAGGGAAPTEEIKGWNYLTNSRT